MLRWHFSASSHPGKGLTSPGIPTQLSWLGELSSRRRSWPTSGRGRTWADLGEGLGQCSPLPPQFHPTGEAGPSPVRFAVEGLGAESPHCSRTGALTWGMGDDLPRILRAATGAVAGCGAQAPCGDIMAIRATIDPWSCYEKWSTALVQLSLE